MNKSLISVLSPILVVLLMFAIFIGTPFWFAHLDEQREKDIYMEGYSDGFLYVADTILSIMETQKGSDTTITKLGIQRRTDTLYYLLTDKRFTQDE